MESTLLGAVLLVGAALVFMRRGVNGKSGDPGSDVEVLHPTIQSRVEEYRSIAAQETDGLPRVTVPLVLAVIARETSGMNRRGTGGEVGLMQVSKDAWIDYQMSQNDPDANPYPDALDSPNIGIRVGAWYLNRKIEDMRGDLFNGLRAYNCGTYGAETNPTCGAGYATWVTTVGLPAFGGFV